MAILRLHLLGWSYSIFKVNSIDMLLQALEAVQKAIALDPNYAEAYASKAEIEFYYKKF